MRLVPSLAWGVHLGVFPLIASPPNEFLVEI